MKSYLTIPVLFSVLSSLFAEKQSLAEIWAKWVSYFVSKVRIYFSPLSICSSFLVLVVTSEELPYSLILTQCGLDESNHDSRVECIARSNY